MAIRELRLAFAMGGGVSLGAFSGAALTQAIKLVLAECVTSTDPKRRYDRVIIDAFSGASAGAVSLAIMLRGLLDRDDAQTAGAAAALHNDPVVGPAYRQALATPAQSMLARQLEAAQHAQNLQRQVWVEDMRIENLLGEARRMINGKGLFDLDFLKTLAGRYTTLPSDAQTWRTQLLAPRILLCCTLANLSPITVDGRNSVDTSKGAYIALTDGLRSTEHRDLRIFDLRLTRQIIDPESPDDPTRWVRYHVFDEIAGKVGDLRAQKTWLKIFLTAAACGAFPFAFAPVVLKRDWWEYGQAYWPKSLWGNADKPLVKEFPFSYIDGGLFNNEPIREAFRLSSFLDARYPREQDGEPVTSCRRVIFVDPFVEPEHHSLRLGIHSDYAQRDAGWMSALAGIRVDRLTTLERFKPHAALLVGALRSQSSVNEADRVSQTRSVFALRDQMRVHLARLLNPDPAVEQIVGMLRECARLLDRDRKLAAIPPRRLTIRDELLRIADEEPTLRALRPAVSQWPVGPEIPEVLDPAVSRSDWLHAAAFVAVDVIMELEGKSEDSTLLAIAPFLDIEALLSKLVGPDGNPRGLDLESLRPHVIDLPAGHLSGFAGFLSPRARVHAFDAGKVAAAEFLHADDRIDKPAGSRAAVSLNANELQQIESDVRAGLKRLSTRLGELLSAMRLIDAPAGLNRMIADLISAWFVKPSIRDLPPAAPPHTTRFEFRIHEVGSKHRLKTPDGAIRPIQIGDGIALVTFLDYHHHAAHERDRWQGPAIDRQTGLLSVRTSRPFCGFRLPSTPLVEQAMRDPQAIFVTSIPKSAQTSPIESGWTIHPGIQADA